jgi:putative DNA primase/helicase
LATGAASGLVVVDVDPRHSGDETLAQLEAEHGPIPPTWRFLTGGGGEHILFQHPGGHVKSSANALGPGIDVRADGGYIIAPPSTHISGRRYEISVDHHPEDVALASLPDWLLRKLGAGRGAPHVRRPSAGGSTDWQAFASTRISEGERNLAITRLAGLLFSRLNRTPHLAAELVLAWNATHCSPPLDEEEVWRTIESIAQREAQKLRGASYGQ